MSVFAIFSTDFGKPPSECKFCGNEGKAFKDSWRDGIKFECGTQCLWVDKGDSRGWSWWSQPKSCQLLVLAQEQLKQHEMPKSASGDPRDDLQVAWEEASMALQEVQNIVKRNTKTTGISDALQRSNWRLIQIAKESLGHSVLVGKEAIRLAQTCSECPMPYGKHLPDCAVGRNVAT